MKNKWIYLLGGTFLIGIVIILILFKVFPSKPDETEAFKCGNGKTVFRYKNPSEAFPVVIRDYSASFSVTTDVLKKLVDSSSNMSLSIDAKNKIIELQEKLNQDNITFSTALRSYFFSCNSDPCNENLQAKYLSFVEDMSKRMFELRKFVATTTVSTTKGGADSSIITGLATELDTDTSRVITAVNNLHDFLAKK